LLLIFNIHLLSTNDSQYTPKYPFVHIHVKSPGSSSVRHCPLFWQGFAKHGLSIWLLHVRPKMNLIRYKIITLVLNHIFANKMSPVYPVSQTHEKLLFEFGTHSPWEPHGLFVQGSISILLFLMHPLIPIPLPVYPCRHVHWIVVSA